MGLLIISDSDFSFEWNSTENSTPPGSADLPDQPVLTSIMVSDVDFEYRFPAAAGVEFTVDAVSGNHVTDLGQTWSPGEWGSHGLEFTSGACSGKQYLITNNTADTIYCLGVDFIAEGVVVGDKFIIQVIGIPLTENSTPPGSADIEKQPVLTIIQAADFDFIYHVLPVGFADSYTVHTHTTTSITVSGTPFAGLDLSNKAVIITSGALEDYFFYITAYDDSTVKGSGIDLTGLVDDVDTFIIHVPAIVTEENATPPASADLPEQDVLQNLQHWSEGFFFAFVLVTEKFFHIHVQSKGLKPLDNATITVTDLDHPGVPPDTIYTNKFGNVTYEATILSRYRFDVVAKNFYPFSFELGMLTSQPAIRGIKTLLHDFKSIIVTKEEEEAVEESG